MATHDYIIGNASGASVRADLNNALAAIVSNNSNATSPATTYAFQFWADTTTGQLKIRNAANSAWITLMELDGTMLMEDGTVSAPGLAFASDTNTGFFRSAADKINFATGGTERLEIGSSEVVFNDPSNDVDFRVESNSNAHMLFVDAGNNVVGIGTSSPDSNTQLHVNNSSASGTIRVTSSANSQGLSLTARSDGNGSQIVAEGNNSHLRLYTDSGGTDREVVRIDSLGRLLVGTTLGNDSGSESNLVIEANSSSGSSYGGLMLRRGSTSIGSGTSLGRVYFADKNGNTGARISALGDGTWATDDYPGSLVFSTTADGASSPTERMRIQSGGGISFNGDTAQANALDDYEEGTFTPTLSFSNLSVSSYSVQNGSYIKVGRIVHVNIYIIFSGSNLSGTPQTNGEVYLNLPVAAGGEQFISEPAALGRLAEFRGTNDSTDFDRIYHTISNTSSSMYFGVNKQPATPQSSDFLFGMSEKSFNGLIGQANNFEYRHSFTYEAA